MSASAAQMALPSGETDAAATPDPSLAVYGAVVLGIAAVVVMGALMAAWLAVRAGTAGWPPKGVKVENYFGTTLSATMLMSGLTGWWVLYAVRRSERRQAAFGLTVAIFLELSFINLLTYVVRGSHLGPATSAYGTLFYAVNVGTVLVAATGILVDIVALIRVLGYQVSAAAPQLGWVAAWYGTVVSVVWFVMYATVYVVK